MSKISLIRKQTFLPKGSFKKLPYCYFLLLLFISHSFSFKFTSNDSSSPKPPQKVPQAKDTPISTPKIRKLQNSPATNPYPPTVEILQTSPLSLTSALVSSPTSLTIAFKAGAKFSEYKNIVINLGESLELASASSNCCSVLQGSISCPTNCGANINTITFDGFFTGTLTVNQQIVFTLNNLIAGRTAGTSRPVAIEIYDDNGNIVAAKDGLTFELTPAYLKDASVTASSNVNYAQNTYTFKYKVTNTLRGPLNFITKIPPEVMMTQDFPSCQIKIGDGPLQDAICTYYRNEEFINIHKYSDKSKFELIQPPIGGEVSVQYTITDFGNPKSFKYSSPFELTIQLDDTDKLIAKLSDTLTEAQSKQLKIKNEQKNIFVVSEFKPSSYITGETTDYTIKFELFFTTIPTEKIKIILDKQIDQTLQYQNLVISQGNSVILTKNSVTKDANANNILELVVSFKNPGQPGLNTPYDFEIVLSNIRNPCSFRPFSFFSINFYSSDDYILQGSADDAKITLTMQQAHKFKKIMLQTEGNVVPKTTQSYNYVLTLEAFNELKADDSLLVVVPEELEFEGECLVSNLNAPGTGVSCTQKTSMSINGQVKNLGSKTYLIKNCFTNTNSVFYLLFKNIKISQNFKTDATNAVSSFQISSLEEDKDLLGNSYFYQKDSETDNLKISFSCAYPCLTCPDDEPTHCLTCQSTQNNKFAYEGICFADCPSNTVKDDAQKKCVKCADGCESCLLLDVNYCLACLPAFPFFQEKYHRCMMQCPVGTFTVGTLCNECDNKCRTCVNSATYCNECTENFYYYEHQCLTACPSNTAPIVVDDGKICIDCNINCKTCSGAPEQCTSCYENYVLYNSKCIHKSECLSEKNLYLDAINNICLPCISNCKVCGSSENDCLECISGHKFILGECRKTNCEQGYYLTIFNDCEICNSNCVACSGTANNCSLCQNDTNFFMNECLNSCPDGYYSSKKSNLLYNVCERCSTTCYTCTGSEIDQCTSCVKGLVLLNGRCITENACSSLNGYFLETSIVPYRCLECTVTNCMRCSYDGNFENFCKCSRCYDGYILMENSCIEITNLKDLCTSKYCDAPKETEIAQFKVVRKKPSDYFSIPALFFTFLILATLLRMFLDYLKYFSACMFIFALFERLLIILVFVYCIKSKIKKYIIMSSLVFFFSICIGVLFFIYLLAFLKKDPKHSTWRASIRRIIFILIAFNCIILDYKFMCVTYCRLFHNIFFCAKFSNFKKYLTVYRLVTLLHFLLVLYLMVSLCAMICVEYIKYSFLWYLAIYAFVFYYILAVYVFFEQLFAESLINSIGKDEESSHQINPEMEEEISESYSDEEDTFSKKSHHIKGTILKSSENEETNRKTSRQKSSNSDEIYFSGSKINYDEENLNDDTCFKKNIIKSNKKEESNNIINEEITNNIIRNTKITNNIIENNDDGTFKKNLKKYAKNIIPEDSAETFEDCSVKKSVKSPVFAENYETFGKSSTIKTANDNKHSLEYFDSFRKNSENNSNNNRVYFEKEVTKINGKSDSLVDSGVIDNIPVKPSQVFVEKSVNSSSKLNGNNIKIKENIKEDVNSSNITNSNFNSSNINPLNQSNLLASKTNLKNNSIKMSPQLMDDTTNLNQSQNNMFLNRSNTPKKLRKTFNEKELSNDLAISSNSIAAYKTDDYLLKNNNSRISDFSDFSDINNSYRKTGRGLNIQININRKKNSLNNISISKKEDNQIMKLESIGMEELKKQMAQNTLQNSENVDSDYIIGVSCLKKTQNEMASDEKKRQNLEEFKKEANDKGLKLYSVDMTNESVA